MFRISKEYYFENVFIQGAQNLARHNAAGAPLPIIFSSEISRGFLGAGDVEGETRPRGGLEWSGAISLAACTYTR